MDTRFSIPIINPAFELLKRSSRFLHFIAAVAIAAVAIHQLSTHDGYKLICWSQLIIAADLFVLVSVPSFVVAMPLVSILFRFAETVILFGNGIMLMDQDHWAAGIPHIIMALAFLFLLRREWRIYHSENIDITHTGITIPHFSKDAELTWPEIKTVMLEYHMVVIETLRNKKIEINLRKGLKFDEKIAIDEFCSQHLAGA